MCRECGGGTPDDDHAARYNRERFEGARVLALNLMGSPGSGKTALLEATARAVGDRLKLGALSGALATDGDARRLKAAGIPSKAVATGHLDAKLVHEALHDFSVDELDLFVIENAGSLVCTAVHDLGQAANVVAFSVAEGEDTPLKYPVMFQKADLVVLTKIDLVPHVDVDLEAICSALGRVMPRPRMLLVSAKTGTGVGDWVGWIERRRAALQISGTHA